MKRKMKKVFTGLTLFLFSISLVSRAGDGDMKDFRFGGSILPSFDWYKPDNLKKFSKNGVVPHFGILINGEYSFASHFAVGFGIGLSSAGGKIDFTPKNDTVHYYFNDDQGMLALADTAGLKGKWEHFRLIDRKYRASYYMIPISLKMRTNEIGYLRYFFEPRLNIGIRKKVRANDNVQAITTTTATTTYDMGTFKDHDPQEDIDITKDMALLHLSATISAGAEYSLSGSTALIFSIGYDYGLSNAVQKNSEFLLKSPYVSDNVKPKAVDQKFIQNGIVLSVGILF
jgi:hypothetical protein